MPVYRHALHEIALEVNTFRMDFPDGSGLTTEVTTKAGNNTFHGTADFTYGYYYNMKLDSQAIDPRAGFTYINPNRSWFTSLNYTHIFSPNLQQITLPLNLAVDEGCLFCHTSGVQPATVGMANHFGDHPMDIAHEQATDHRIARDRHAHGSAPHCVLRVGAPLSMPPTVSRLPQRRLLATANSCL